MIESCSCTDYWKKEREDFYLALQKTTNNQEKYLKNQEGRIHKDN